MKHSWIAGLIACGMLLFAAGAYTLSLWSESLRGEVIDSQESRYQNLYITSKDSIVTLRAGSLMDRSSAVDLDDPHRLVLEYTRMMMLGTAYVDKPRTMLMVGLGGGTLSKYLRRYYPEARIVNIEFDDAVPPLAEKYFGFALDDDMELHVMDGRRFLRETEQRFDIIFLDAFHGGYIPFHLMTREFLELVKERLTPEGVVVSNTWRGQELAARESATYRAVFGACDSYLGVRSSNRIIVARRDGTTMGRDELRQRMADTQQRLGFEEIDLQQLFAEHYHEMDAASHAEVLTDDYAPVNLLVDRRSILPEEE